MLGVAPFLLELKCRTYAKDYYILSGVYIVLISMIFKVSDLLMQLISLAFEINTWRSRSMQMLIFKATYSFTEVVLSPSSKMRFEFDGSLSFVIH